MQDDFKHQNRLELFPDTLGLPGLLHVGRYRHTAAGKILAPHLHKNGLEICYLAKGKQRYRVAGREYALSGGDCYWVLGDELHDSAGKPQEKGVLYWMVLDCTNKSRGLLNLRGKEAQKFRQALQTMPSRHFRVGPDAQPILEQFLDVIAGADPLKEIRAGELLLRFLLMVLDASGNNTAREPSPTIRRTLRHINAHLHKPLPLEELAALSGLSVSRFKGRFREELGVPPGEYVLRRKVEQAAEWLSQTERSITQTAMDLGFSSSQYFATVFRRFMLKTPSDYRREHETHRGQ